MKIEHNNYQEYVSLDRRLRVVEDCTAWKKCPWPWVVVCPRLESHTDESKGWCAWAISLKVNWLEVSDSLERELGSVSEYREKKI